MVFHSCKVGKPSHINQKIFASTLLSTSVKHYWFGSTICQVYSHKVLSNLIKLIVAEPSLYIFQGWIQFIQLYLVKTYSIITSLFQFLLPLLLDLAPDFQNFYITDSRFGYLISQFLVKVWFLVNLFSPRPLIKRAVVNRWKFFIIIFFSFSHLTEIQLIGWVSQ